MVLTTTSVPYSLPNFTTTTVNNNNSSNNNNNNKRRLIYCRFEQSYIAEIKDDDDDDDKPVVGRDVNKDKFQNPRPRPRTWPSLPRPRPRTLASCSSPRPRTLFPQGLFKDFCRLNISSSSFITPFYFSLRYACTSSTLPYIMLPETH